MKEEIALIVGRTVADYILCGHRIPATAKIVNCVMCGDHVALGTMGQVRLKPGESLVFCTPCIEGMARGGEIKAAYSVKSPDLEEQFRRNPGLEKKLMELLRMMGTK